ncbi:DUF4097 family beta strand repeat-containing protein [Streptomyces sp. NPDC017979]|uniref:DUF4097 family beta strand repeat-containing protein n=1 Tax=Streptomyces sp. NPDC017979 TaxID=3365024 RepID=UPI0037BB05C0
MTQSSWEVADERRLVFDAPVTAVDVRIVNGTVNVVGTDGGSARLEVSSVEGPPLIVTQEGTRVTVAYRDLPWQGWSKWLDRKGWHRSAVVSLVVPARADVAVGVVDAAAVVSGVEGDTSVHGVSGDTTLVRLSGRVRAESVSGGLEAQSVTGELSYDSVSGDLTVIDGAGPSVRAGTVSGNMLVDLAPSGGAPVGLTLTSVSGDVAVRLPDLADAQVDAETAGGAVTNAFDGLTVTGEWGAKRVTGTLGAGAGSLRASTVSGSIALLRKPPVDEEGAASASAAGSAPGPTSGKVV